MKNQLIQLFKVKSIVTITTVFVFAYLAVTGRLEYKDSFVIISMVFTYMFNKDVKDKKES